MNYLLFVYHSEKASRARPPAEREAIYQRCMAHIRNLAEAGTLIDGAPLQPVATARTVRVRDGETIVTDGPFAETKEQLGGYFLVRCADRDEACRHAEDLILEQENALGGMEVRASLEGN